MGAGSTRDIGLVTFSHSGPQGALRTLPVIFILIIKPHVPQNVTFAMTPGQLIALRIDYCGNFNDRHNLSVTYRSVLLVDLSTFVVAAYFR